MRKNIHPNYQEIQVSCACGNSFKTHSTYSKGKSIAISICSKCHPAYTGKRKFVDETGRIEKFNKKYQTK